MISSPLRYPGGKAKLFPYFSRLIQQNGLFGADYCEPYAGGAGLAIKLLTCGFVDAVRINDIDHSVYAFWTSALRSTDQFCRMIERTPITIREWHRQKNIWKGGNGANALELGFATYFLNRTNRSGIIDGAGPIGGYNQTGTWKIDARLIKDKQIDNLRSLARYSQQIKITKRDAMHFFNSVINKRNAFVYLDPPYFVKGHKLYKNSYEESDHRLIAEAVRKHHTARWVISYDDVPQIRKVYAGLNSIRYSLNYSAGEKGVGTEVMFASGAIVLPSAELLQAA
jgi:DNA adenine methylase